MTALPLTVEYEIDAAGEWRFRVRGGNHEIICIGEGYKERRSAEHAIAVLTSGLQTAKSKILGGIQIHSSVNALLRPAKPIGETFLGAQARNALAPLPRPVPSTNVLNRR